MSNVHEYDLTEDDFDKFVIKGKLTLLNSETFKDDNYKLYGQSFASNPKFKNYEKDGKDAFSIMINTPEEIFCHNCDINFKSGKNPDKCPICGKTIYDILDNNRRFQQEWEDFCYKVNQDKKEEMINEQPRMLIKYGLLADNEEAIEKHKEMLRMGNK